MYTYLYTSLHCTIDSMVFSQVIVKVRFLSEFIAGTRCQKAAKQRTGTPSAERQWGAIGHKQLLTVRDVSKKMMATVMFRGVSPPSLVQAPLISRESVWKGSAAPGRLV
jgi:hypothetical protein